MSAHRLPVCTPAVITIIARTGVTVAVIVAVMGIATRTVDTTAALIVTIVAATTAIIGIDKIIVTIATRAAMPTIVTTTVAACLAGGSTPEVTQAATQGPASARTPGFVLQAGTRA